jgi:hypothetical protein
VDPESQVGEVFLKDKFLKQSAPDICRKLQKSVAEGEKSLDQLMQLAMSVYYNQDVTKKKEKDKRHHDLITSLRECPTRYGGLYSELATVVDRRGTATENVQKGDSLGDSTGPHWDSALSAKVTIGGLSAPISRWKAGFHLPWIDGSWRLLSRCHFLTSRLRSLE